MSLAATSGIAAWRGRARSSPWATAWRRYRRNRMALAGGVVAILVLLVAIAAPLLAPGGYQYSNLSETLQGPSRAHWLGTDAVGRDFLARLIYGARTSMTVGFGVPIIGALIGLPIGAIAGWFGGWLDFLTQRMVEVGTAVPPLLVGLLLIALYGSGLSHVVLFLGITSWIAFARITRAQFFALRTREFVVAAQATGTPPWRIMLAHILPNALGPIIILLVQSIPAAVFAEAGYSFLGLGVQDPLPSWGKMIADGGRYMQLVPLVALMPIFCIGLTMLSFSFVGDGCRDALDPNALE
jgi:ABC-type dipeptide/oligopeptide/nickel transport system permease subunit